MVLFLDANVILDYLLEREEQFKYARQIFTYCRTADVKGYVAFHSISVIWYHLRKFPALNRRKLLAQVTDLLRVASVDHDKVVDAILDEDFPDFEDCLQEKCALEVGADYIVTNNVKDFSASQVKAVTPAEMIDIINS